jgi:integrase
MANRWGKVSLSSCAAALRPFFLYAESRGLCRAGMARAIEGPPRRQVSPSQKTPIPEWKEVLRLLHSTKGRTPIAIRARAILILLCFYGLRRSEIVRLEMNDFDWKNHIFTVRRAKRGGLQQFPLLREVSDAVLRYIQNARPRSSCRNVFLSFHPPFGSMNPASIYEIVSYRLKRLHIRSRHRGPHALRHACATELLKRGISPREIADFLGHRTCQSVGIYAKFDMHSLQKVSGLDISKAI